MRFLIVLTILLIPTSVFAESVCEPQDYDSKAMAPDFNCPSPGELSLRVNLGAPQSIAVKQGESVIPPWDGALVHRSRIVELGMMVRALRRLRWMDRLRLNEEFAIRLNYVDRTTTARLEFTAQQRDAYRDRALTAERSGNSWWKSPVLWFAIGFVVAGALVALAAYGLSSVGG